MANTDPNLDAGMPITALSNNVLAILAGAVSQYRAASAATGLSSEIILAPLVREMNKTSVDDYNILGSSALSSVVNSIKIRLLLTDMC